MTLFKVDTISIYVKTFRISLKSHRWWSMRILYFSMFINLFTTSCIFTNIYSYLKSLNQDTTDIFYSCVISVYPLGIFISSPLLGFWFNKINTRQPIVFVLVLVTLSNIVYVYCNLLPPKLATWVVLVTRFLMGVGSGSRSIITAYATAATTIKERTAVMTNIYFFVPFAFLLGPLIGVMFEPLGSEGYQVPLIKLSLNLYTCPILVCAGLATVNLILMIWFKEFLITPITTRKTYTDQYLVNRMEIEALISNSTEQPAIPNKPFDRIAFGSLVGSSLSSYLLVTITDSLLTPLIMDQYTLTSGRAILYNNLLISLCCCISMFTIRSFHFLEKFAEERFLYLLFMAILSLAFFIYIPWPGDLPEPIHQIQVNSKLTTELIGCNYLQQPWCQWVPKLSVIQYVTATIIFCVNFPMLYLGSNTIASKVIGPHPPGVLMGILSASTAVGRCLGPLIFVPIYSWYGPQITFAGLEGVVIFMILLTLLTYKRLVPYSNS